MVHLSHAVTDGVGGVEMFANLYDLERDPPAQDAPPLPIPQDLSPNDLMRQGINRLPGTIVGGVRDVLFGAAQAVGQAVRDPVSPAGQRHRLRDVGRPGDGPGRRPVAAAAPAQPVVAQRGHRHRVRRPAPGGQGCRRVDQRRLPRRPVRCAAALPRGQRRTRRHAADGGPGEPALRWRIPRAATGSPASTSRRRSALPTRRVRIQNIRIADDAEARRACHRHGRRDRPRGEPAARQRAGVHGRVDRDSDVQASNVPVYAGDTFIAGAKVLAAVRPWATARRGDDGRADLALRLLHDHHPLRQGGDHRSGAVARCLLAGFDEVLALGGDGRATPASFTGDSPTESTTQRHRMEVRRNDFAERKCRNMTPATDRCVCRVRSPRSRPARPGPRSARSSTWTAPWSPDSPAW